MLQETPGKTIIGAAKIKNKLRAFGQAKGMSTNVYSETVFSSRTNCEPLDKPKE
jgi:hypothetical protein